MVADKRTLARAVEDPAEDHRIVIVDPDAAGMEALATGLESYGYTTVVCQPEEWSQHVLKRSAAVVIGPNLVPRETWKLCRDMRISIESPLVVLTDTGEPDHLSLALDAGADHCFAGRPESAARVVLAAIHAVERRERLARSLRSEVIEVGHLKIDLHRKFAEVHGRRIPLTTTEFGILGVLAQHPGQVISAAHLLREVQGYEVEEAMAQDIVKVHISRLRQKLDTPGVSPCITNVRGQGYMYMFERRGSFSS